MHRTLGIMAKYWEPGQVKTRLARSLVLPRNTRHPEQGEATARPAAVHGLPGLDGFTEPLEVAAKIHQVFVEYLLRQFDRSADLLELVASPPNRLDDFQAVLADPEIAHWQLIDQGGGDLGARMERWFARHLQRLANPTTRSEAPSVDRACVLIGADCPLLSAADLELAWSKLATHDLVLGPAFDGGYYLIGISRRGVSQGREVNPLQAAALFTDIPWGSETVFQRTVAAAERVGVSVAILERRHDVDTAADLQVLLASLRDFNAPSHPLLKALSAIKPCVL